MKQPRSDSYESQLTPPELQHLREALLCPDAELPQLQQTLPAWCSGPRAGAKPTIRTLRNIAARLRDEDPEAEKQRRLELIRQTKRKLFKRSLAADDETISKTLHQVIGLEILEKSLSLNGLINRDKLLRMFIKQELIAVRRAKLFPNGSKTFPHASATILQKARNQKLTNSSKPI